jgi:lipoprotein-anchoring transpeptidase ErfK/SrfK
MHDTVPPTAVPAASEPRRSFRLSKRARLLVVGATILVLVVAGVVGVGYYKVSGIGAEYQSARGHLTADLAAADQAGLSAAELAPFKTQLADLDRSRPLLPTGLRVAFDQKDIGALNRIDADLKVKQQEVLTSARDMAIAEVAGAEAAAAHDVAIGVPDSDLATLQQKLAEIKSAQAAATSVKSWRSVGGDAAMVRSSLVDAGTRQTTENTAIQAAASALLRDKAGNAGEIQKVGAASLSSGRNDASLASYEAKPGRFPKLDELMAPYNRMEFYQSKLGSPDVNQVATAAAAVQRYSGQVHEKLMANLGPKHIVYNWTEQHMYAYENGNLVREHLGTSGVRGVTAYGTDFGPMKVEWKSHPWKMHSPWPRGSQYWYPDTNVQWAVFFTTSGESLHDAYWQPDSTLGPNSQYSAWTRSHGCIHIPISDAEWVFNWSDVGMPVTVYPGDGTPVADQLKLMTTDDQGHPLNPAG